MTKESAARYDLSVNLKPARRARKSNCFRTVNGMVEKRCPCCKEWLLYTGQFFGMGKYYLLHYLCRKCNVKKNAAYRKTIERASPGKFSDEGLKMMLSVSRRIGH